MAGRTGAARRPQAVGEGGEKPKRKVGPKRPSLFVSKALEAEMNSALETLAAATPPVVMKPAELKTLLGAAAEKHLTGNVLRLVIEQKQAALAQLVIKPDAEAGA